ncbi:MAG TPA: epoxyalkane--coenzyme M transferase, partial [Acidimicrobiia bacterium]|nr:epoxyalkane--coenzyme M transferase [Acidimicrobiia bacterium]
MFRSTERILTTHAGSLPRPTDLLPLVKAQEAGTGDNAVFDAAVRSSVEEVVRKQAGTGVDLVNDGEMSKPSYATYVNDRLSGFDGEGSLAHVAGKLIDTEYPDALEQVVARFEALASLKCASCDGPIRY